MKTFLSIGSGPGIGLATAERFAREGYRVVLTSRDQAYVSARVKEFTDAGYHAEGRFVDASAVQSVIDLVRSVETETGSVDVLHFNSAALHDSTIEAQSVDSFIQDLTINIGAGYAVTKEASRGMIERKEGTILLTGGVFAVNPNPAYLSLSVGKAGILNLTKALFDGFREQNVHIATVTVGTLVSAGSTESKEIADAFWQLHTEEKTHWSAEVAYPSA